MKKLPWFWVSRGERDSRIVHLWRRMPLFTGGVYYGRDGVATICYAPFRSLTGLKLKPGECKRVRLPGMLEVES